MRSSWCGTSPTPNSAASVERGFIYGLAHNGEIRYVGKTKRNLRGRLLRHISDARRTDLRPRYVTSWILSVGYEITILSLERDAPDLGQAEIAWIATLRSYGCRLTNIAAGGNGIVIYGRSPWNKGKKGVTSETSKRMSESAKARVEKPRHTEESRRKIATSRSGTEWIREAGRKGALVRIAKGYRWSADDPRRDPAWQQKNGLRVSAGHQRRREALMQSGDARP